MFKWIGNDNGTCDIIRPIVSYVAKQRTQPSSNISIYKRAIILMTPSTGRRKVPKRGWQKQERAHLGIPLYLLLQKGYISTTIYCNCLPVYVCPKSKPEIGLCRFLINPVNKRKGGVGVGFYLVSNPKIPAKKHPLLIQYFTLLHILSRPLPLTALENILFTIGFMHTIYVVIPFCYGGRFVVIATNEGEERFRRDYVFLSFCERSAHGERLCRFATV